MIVCKGRPRWGGSQLCVCARSHRTCSKPGHAPPCRGGSTRSCTCNLFTWLLSSKQHGSSIGQTCIAINRSAKLCYKTLSCSNRHRDAACGTSRVLQRCGYIAAFADDTTMKHSSGVCPISTTWTASEAQICVPKVPQKYSRSSTACPTRHKARGCNVTMTCIQRGVTPNSTMPSATSSNLLARAAANLSELANCFQSRPSTLT